ncbi:MAG TPA: hypothetical protein VK942_02240 [Actinomycetes bacterium]|nr:hypothetical protein [Actinomycetes bacterium]
MTTVSPTQFMAAAPGAMSGNSPWAARYASQLRQVVTEHARGSARNLQIHLGPSEIGSPCDRQVVGKLAGMPTTNHVVDPWASVIGTAVHSWLADAFDTDNRRHGVRWVTEQMVIPHPDHAGTADLYDAVEEAVVDHKILGESSMAKIRPPGDPPLRYIIQLLLYGKGYQLLGLPVRRVALAAYPRTSHTLDGLYVWEREAQPGDDELIDEVFKLTAIRKQIAREVMNGRPLNTVPAKPSNDECYFCPFYRPQSAHDDGPGCPGH